MSMFLLFRLYGPMAAWGEIAVGERRHVQSYPSKSAIMGLVAAALGIRRDQETDHVELVESLGMAVKVDSRGQPLEDYHTAQVPKASHCKGRVFASRRDELNVTDDLNTILSRRDYRTDALATVALWAKVKQPPYTLDVLAKALHQPRFSLYLGRKSCPLALPLQAQVVQAETLLQAFQTDCFAHWPTLQPVYALQKNPELFWEEDNTIQVGVDAQQKNIRRDTPHSRKRWQFANRWESYSELKREV